MEIRKVDPALPELRPLIEGNQRHGATATDSESDHTYGVDDLRHSAVTFFAAFDGPVPLGCGAFMALPDGTAEVKSVFVAEAARGQGVAGRLMNHLAAAAGEAGFSALVLETGSVLCPGYDAARALYERLGYAYCDPIDGYSEDPMSVFMRLSVLPHH